MAGRCLSIGFYHDRFRTVVLKLFETMETFCIAVFN